MISAHPRTNQPQMQAGAGRYFADLKAEEVEYLSWLHRKKSMPKHWTDSLEQDGSGVV